MKTKYIVGFIVILAVLLTLSSVGRTSAASVTIEEDETTFTSLPGVENIPIPDVTSENLHPWPQYTGYSCNAGSTGISLAGGSILVKENVNPDYICILLPEWNAPPTNIDPWPLHPTIVANGEDDYKITINFTDPVVAVGFRLVTNYSASESITLNFSDNTSQTFADGLLGTSSNSREFVGFKSSHAITQVVIDTTNGAVQNEGIDGIWVIENSPPTPDAGGPYTGDVGEELALSGTASDPDGDPVTYAWSVNSSNCQFQNSDTSNPKITCQLIGTYTLTLTVSDGFYTRTDTASLLITDPYLIKNVSDCPSPSTHTRYNHLETLFVSSYGSGANTPVVTSSTLDPALKYLVEVNGVFYAGGTNTYDIRADAKYTQDLYQRNHGIGWTDILHAYESYGYSLLELKVDGNTVTWGDFNPSHQYTYEFNGTGEPATFDFQIYDIYAQNNTGGLCVDLYEFENEAPTADPGGPYLGAVNTAISFNGSSSSDPDGDPLTYAWTFGDGGTGSGATPTHTYTSAEIYDVCLTVNDGYVDSTNVCTLAVVYDPSAGFVTGGGWINSPTGAYADDPTLSGKATFGFVAKYKKGANVPDGSTEFQFKAGDLNFHSTSYQWLVVAGDMAQFKGVGTVNGEGEYLFKIFADDDSPDTFRIIIWTNDEDNPFYDSGVQDLGGGSIVVHK